jgi:glycosyltransferase involved in cell wall biosynthesis
MPSQSTPSAGSTPRVSVCLPVYNGSDYVADAVRSVLRQTWTDFELVVQDNASTDKTLSILESFQDSRISVVRNPTNVGVTGNINRAMMRSRGEYIRLLCHDDVLAPTCLEEQVRLLDAHPSVAVVFTWFEGIDAAGRSVGPMYLDRLVPEPEILRPGEAAIFLYSNGCVPHMSTAMGRRESLIPFDESFHACCDLAKWAEVSSRADIAVIREILCAVRWHDQNLTHSMRQFHVGEIYRVLELLEPRLPPGFPAAQARRRLLGEREFAYAVWLVLRGEVERARAVLDTIRRHDPLLPVALGFFLSRPAWIKRRLAARNGWAHKAQASAELR